MKRRFLVILIALCALCMGFIACEKSKKESQKENPRYVIDGVTDIALSVEQTEYDFLNGIVGWDGTTLTDVSVDASAVAFGKVGVYEITYTLKNVSQKATVRVYGTPEIIGEAEYETNYSGDLDVFAGVTGKDSFGMELTVTTNHEFEKDEFGRIVYGDHFFRYYVTDSVGNKAYLDRTFTVKPPEGYEFGDVFVTKENPEAIIDISDKVLEKVIYDGEIVASGLYTVEEGTLDMTKLALLLGKGQHVCNLSFEGGYADVVLDMQITAQQYYARPIVGEEMVKLFKPYDIDGTHDNYVCWDETEQAFHFVNYITEQDDTRGFYMDTEYFHELIEKGKAEIITFEMKFEVQDDPNVQFYQGFIPNWWDSSFIKMQLKTFKAGYQTVTVDLSKTEKVDNQYKTLFILATIGGFYIKNIQVEYEVSYEPAKVYDLDGESCSMAPLSISEAHSISSSYCSVVDSSSENVPSGIEGKALKIEASKVPLYAGGTLSVAEGFTVESEDVVISLRLYIKSNANKTVEWFVYNPTCDGKAGETFIDTLKGMKTNEWVEVKFKAKDYLVDGKFVGLQFINCTTDLSEIYIDSVTVMNVIKGA